MKKILFLLFILYPLISFSQKEAAIWYFGQNAGLDFNSGTPVVLTDGQLNTFEGCATISDFQGDLLFYTDGVSVWDKTHNIMPNGNDLLGNPSSTQSAIIIPKPNNINQYYIFTVDDNPNAVSSDGINYSVVDLTLNSGLGDVTAQKNVPLLANAYENITAVKHATDNSVWVITFLENQFRTWLVDAAGVNTMPSSPATYTDNPIGYLKTSPDGTKIVSANYGSGPSLMLYDFNSATGVISNEQQLILDESDDYPYGVEFSTYNSKLYVSSDKQNTSGRTPPSKIVQYDLTSANISNSRVLIHSSQTNTRGALQLAIDGKIYHALSNSIGTNQAGTNFLGVINNPEVNGLACNYVYGAIDISGGDPNRKVVEGLPPFIQSFFTTSITATNFCFGEATQFNLSANAVTTGIVWDFGDPASGSNNSSTLLSPTHIFSSPGTYNVSAVISNGTGSSTATLEVTIYESPIVTSPVTLIQCDDDDDGIVNFNLEEANSLISSDNPPPTFSYYLNENDALNSNNEIQNPTTFSNAISSTVWARVEYGTNCFATAEIILEVASTEIPADLMIPFSECDDDSDGITTFDFSDATNIVIDALPSDTTYDIKYYETIEDALAEQNAIDETNYTNITPNSQQIVVRVDNLSNECYGLGYHVTLNVIEAPEFDLESSMNFCDDTAIKTIGVENPAAPYDYVWVDELGNSIGTSESITINSSGTYSITATDPSNSTCVTTKSIDVQIKSIPIVNSPATLIQCDGDGDGIVDFNLEEANSIISIEDPAPNFTYYLNESDANSATDAIQNPTVFSNAIATLVWVRVENATNCFATAQINLQIDNTEIPNDMMPPFNECDINSNGIATFDFSSATQIILTELGDPNLEISYYETSADALAEQNAIDETSFTNTIPYSQIIHVRADNSSNECYGVGSPVTLNVVLAPQFDLDNEINFCEETTDKTIGVETPSGEYNYEWNDALGNIVGTTQSISVTTSGIYTVTVTDQIGENCTATKDINVIINPIVINPVWLIECNNDGSLVIEFNLEEANSLISSETPPPSIRYYLTEDDASNATNLIPNPTTFSISENQTVWARVEDTDNCVATTKVELQINSIVIPNKELDYYECNTNLDTNSNIKTATFNFRDEANEYLFEAARPLTGLAISYYETIDDAEAMQNAINPANYNYSFNESSHEIVVRMDDLQNNCYAIGTPITLHINPLPQFDLLETISFCFLTNNHTIGIQNPSSDYKYEWTDQFGNTAGDTPEITISKEGLYTVTATDINGNDCSLVKSINVEGEPIGVLPNFSKDNIKIVDNSKNNTITVLTTNLPVSSYEFALDNESFQTNNYFENVSPGLHTIKIRDLENCLAASVDVSIISAPKFFTPNTDGFNDDWQITGIEFQPTSKIYIFDRFGKLLAKIDPLSDGWNGLYNGNPLPATDYWFKAELDDGRVITGHFSLIRKY